MTPQIVGVLMMCSVEAADVFDLLQADHAESPVGLGIVSSSQSPTMVMTRDGDDGTSWSIVVVNQDGGACIAFTGNSWQTVRGFDGSGYE